MYICTYYHSAIFTNDVTYIYESCLNGPPHAHQRQQSSTISTVCLMRMYICMCHHSAIFSIDVTYVYESCHNDFHTLIDDSGLLVCDVTYIYESCHNNLDTLINASGLPQLALYSSNCVMSHTYTTHVTTTSTRPLSTEVSHNYRVAKTHRGCLIFIGHFRRSFPAKEPYN